MENNLQVFSNDEFGSVRMLMINDEPWFVGKDIAQILGYQNASKALADHVDDEDKLNNESLSSLGQRGGWLVNESGLYSLILSSKLENARKFKHWVTSDVLPKIRKTGTYVANREDRAILAIVNAKDNVARAVAIGEYRDLISAPYIKKIEEDKPKVDFCDQVTETNGAIKIAEFANELQKDLHVNIGQNKLFAILRDKGYLQNTRANWNRPYQKYINAGYFRVVKGGTAIGFVPVTLITGKGQTYLFNALRDVVISSN